MGEKDRRRLRSQDACESTSVAELRTGTFTSILSSSASPFFAASLPTPLVDLETDGRAGPIQNCSVSSFLSSIPLLLPTASQLVNPIDKEGYHFEGLLPTFLVGTSTSTDDDNDKRTTKEDLNPTDNPIDKTYTTDLVHRHAKYLYDYDRPRNRPRPSPQYPAHDLHYQASNV
ncbi:hypothetical protein O988_03648 [Pseudogymnoascus sp. VKM F-3808]|nr:hypothetical protein O988_03648 [Pseudogymnoascus sp. VKM F-3808]